MEAAKPPNCCRSNTTGLKHCWRYYVCWVPEHCDPVYAHLEAGVALVYQGITTGTPDVHRWHWRHTEIIPAIFRQATWNKGRTDVDGDWYGEVRAALLSGLFDGEPIDIEAAIPLTHHFPFPLNPLFGPEDPDFLPDGFNFSGFNTRSAMVAAFPDVDLRMLPT